MTHEHPTTHLHNIDTVAATRNITADSLNATKNFGDA